MSKSPEIDKKYVSPYDQLLHGFDATHALTTSQQCEIDKHEQIFKQRDHVNTDAEKNILWDKF